MEEVSEMGRLPSSRCWSFPAYVRPQCRASQRSPEIPKLVASRPPTWTDRTLRYQRISKPTTVTIQYVSYIPMYEKKKSIIKKVYFRSNNNFEFHFLTPPDPPRSLMMTRFESPPYSVSTNRHALSITLTSTNRKRTLIKTRQSMNNQIKTTRGPAWRERPLH